MNSDFPFGVKVTYRAYSQPAVYELTTDHNSINQVSVQLCKVSDYPEEKIITPNGNSSSQEITIPEGKRSESLHSCSHVHPFPIGMYVLQKLPDFKKEEMPFQSFIPGGREEFDKCFNGIRKFYGENSVTTKDWLLWKESVVPENDDVETFLEQ